jgi:hypothetical protein
MMWKKDLERELATSTLLNLVPTKPKNYHQQKRVLYAYPYSIGDCYGMHTPAAVAPSSTILYITSFMKNGVLLDLYINH